MVQRHRSSLSTFILTYLYPTSQQAELKADIAKVNTKVDSRCDLIKQPPREQIKYLRVNAGGLVRGYTILDQVCATYLIHDIAGYLSHIPLRPARVIHAYI